MFTIDDVLDLQRDFSDMELLHIEEAVDCDGEACGSRPDLILSADEYRSYVEICGPRPPVRPHCHIVIARTHRDAKRYRFYVRNHAALLSS